MLVNLYLLTISLFSYFENHISYVLWVFIISLFYSFIELNVDGILVISVVLTYLSIGIAFPFIGIPLMPLPLLSWLSFRIPNMELSGSNVPESLGQINSLLYMFLQSLACVMVLLLSTIYFIFL